MTKLPASCKRERPALAGRQHALSWESCWGVGDREVFSVSSTVDEPQTTGDVKIRSNIHSFLISRGESIKEYTFLRTKELFPLL